MSLPIASFVLPAHSYSRLESVESAMRWPMAFISSPPFRIIYAVSHTRQFHELEYSWADIGVLGLLESGSSGTIRVAFFHTLSHS